MGLQEPDKMRVIRAVRGQVGPPFDTRVATAFNAFDFVARNPPLSVTLRRGRIGISELGTSGNIASGSDQEV